MHPRSGRLWLLGTLLGGFWFGTPLDPLLGASVSSVGASPPDPTPATQPALRLYLKTKGVYRVTFEALQQAGLTLSPVPSAELSLTNRGRPVPIWVADGGDSLLGPGDSLEFVGEQLPGESKFFHEYSPWNVYWLRFDRAQAVRMQPPAAADPRASKTQLERYQHLERDQLLIRLSEQEITGPQASDLWFWTKLSQIAAAPFRVDLDLRDLDPEAKEPVRLRVHFRGLSDLHSQSGFPHHRVDVRLAGEPLGSAEWDGRTVHLLELPPVPGGTLSPGIHPLELRVPQRTPPGATETVVDVVMLDWVEVSYPRTRQLVAGFAQAELHLTSPATSVELQTPPGAQLIAYGSRGSRSPATRVPAPIAKETALEWTQGFRLATDEASFFLVQDQAFLQLEKIELDRPSNLHNPEQQADYLMIAHARLLDAIQPLAAMHRKRGLQVAVVDVQDVYDEWSAGIVEPRGIRDFIAHAYHHWQKPAPQFVLLVGDASWDSKNEVVDDSNYADWANQQLLAGGDRFYPRNTPTYRENPLQNQRNLIPSFIFASYQGHSASDNAFVTVDGDDFLPDLAIGRFPVTQPAEVAAIVNKTRHYVETPEVGPWRRSILWITNEDAGFQKNSDKLAKLMSQEGFVADKVYPQSSETTNATHQAELQNAFNQGQLLVHFYGHGGSHIWRTGPPDLRKNHDLFTLEHVEKLQPNGRLPVILSMTCYSAPFDHPNADSIGEKFLREPERGAVAVFAASWRNSPSQAMSRRLLANLTTPKTPIGTAILRTKREIGNRTFIEMYNLLGDPAIALPQPSFALTLEPHWDAQEVSVTIPTPTFHGQASVYWLDGNNQILEHQEFSVTAPQFNVQFQPAEGHSSTTVSGIQVYVWDETTGTDGGGTRFSTDSGSHPDKMVAER